MANSTNSVNSTKKKSNNTAKSARASNTKKSNSASGKKAQIKSVGTGQSKHTASKKQNSMTFGFRQVIALFLFVSSALLFMCVFGLKAVLLDLFGNFFKGIIGVGYYVAPFAFLAGFVMLIFIPERKRRASQAIWTLLVPLFVGMWSHIITSAAGSYIKGGLGGLGALYADGKLFKSGGFISGSLSEIVTFLISVYGAAALLFVLSAIAILYILRFSLTGIYRDIKRELDLAFEKADMRKEERTEEEENESSVPLPSPDIPKPTGKTGGFELPPNIFPPLNSQGEVKPVSRPKSDREKSGERIIDFILDSDPIAMRDNPPTDVDGGKDVIVSPTIEKKFPYDIEFDGEAAPSDGNGAPLEPFSLPKHYTGKGSKTYINNPSEPSVQNFDIPLGNDFPKYTESELDSTVRGGAVEPAQVEVDPPAESNTAVQDAQDAQDAQDIGFTSAEDSDGFVEFDGEEADNIIYEYKEGDEDIILAEAGAKIDERNAEAEADALAKAREMNNAQASSGLRPGNAERDRLRETQAKRKPPEYVIPPISLLSEDSSPSVSAASDSEVRTNAERLITTLASFKIEARITNIIRGPSITRYEIQLSQGIRFSRLTALSDDIALALAAQSVRIAAIPDKVSIGIEVPNKNVSTVYIRDCLSSREFESNTSKVAFALGKDITGKPVVWDIARLPHMLVAGTTGSGKSVCVNSLLVSLLYKASPDDVKLIMIDPKIIELGIYNGIPHLLIPVVTDPKKAAGALQWAVYEMMKRYKLLAELNVHSVSEYNAEVAKRKALNPDDEEFPYVKLPQIVIVIDELSDLMLTAPREVEDSICRIAQMARAAGMHLIIATQRPSADVITGLMKANIPSRIAFAVASAMESRIVLDTQGAEKLIGKGDMLFSPIGLSKPIRIQGCYITAEEIAAVCAYTKKFGTQEYDSDVLEDIEKKSEAVGKKPSSRGNDQFSRDEIDDSDPADSDDPLLNDAIDVVMETQASASMLQRKLHLGYNRAGRLIDIMEERGIIGPSEGSKPRQILISKAQWQEMKARRS